MSTVIRTINISQIQVCIHEFNRSYILPLSVRRDTHAIALAVQEALKAKEAGKEEVILFNLSGHGLLDIATYEMLLDGKL